MFGCNFRGLVIDQGLGFSIHWLGFRVYAFSFVLCGREHKNHWKKRKNSKKTSKNKFFEIFRRLIFRHLDNQVLSEPTPRDDGIYSAHQVLEMVEHWVEDRIWIPAFVVLRDCMMDMNQNELQLLQSTDTYKLVGKMYGMFESVGRLNLSPTSSGDWEVIMEENVEGGVIRAFVWHKVKNQKIVQI